MPSYELAVLYRMLPKEKLTNALKRTADAVFQNGGIIRKINNLGATNQLPYRITVNGKSHREARSFVFEVDCPSLAVRDVVVLLTKDEDVIRRRIFDPVTPIVSTDCKIEEETAPPVFRAEVQEMLKQAEKKKKSMEKRKKNRPNLAIDYDPFQI